MTTFGIPIEIDKGLESKVSGHFGRARKFAIVSEDQNDLRIIDNTSSHYGGSLSPPELLIQHNVDVILCGNIGGGARQRFEASGIKVYVGAKGTILNALKMYKENGIRQATEEDTCHDEGQHHEHHHHH